VAGALGGTTITEEFATRARVLGLKPDELLTPAYAYATERYAPGTERLKGVLEYANLPPEQQLATQEWQSLTSQGRAICLTGSSVQSGMVGIPESLS